MASLASSGSFGREVQSPRVASRRRRWVLVGYNFKTLVGICTAILACLFVGRGYILSIPVHEQGQSFRDALVANGFESIEDCDFFEGKWVKDDSYPLYNGSLCPFAEKGFNCQGNGRKDDNYMKWRWKPHHCEVPRFDVHEILQTLRGLRIVFVGDSMGRTQWESLICLLMTGVSDKKSVYEINGNEITKQIRFLGVRFSSFNFTVEFYRSPFLVQQGIPPRHSPKRVRSTLRLDRLDKISNRWLNSDFLIFNSGHWWNPVKIFDVGCYFQVGNSVKLGMQITSAYRIALNTWASWVKSVINTNRTRVFFRTFEPSHWSEFPTERACIVTQRPELKAGNFADSPFSEIVSDVMSVRRAPVVVLNVTFMSAFRSDAHIGNWGDTPLVEDCSHWCLPGVPDAWNEILLSYLPRKKRVPPT
ncbi:unnamed protein product [Victoria cruziana]